ncbi:hypothetical protein [uncultured Prevotella sp.]|uniref:hypothetical protein n=1 Tax=uncultured Prevotella sp. TaxID=159272 RepID=UPI0026DAD6EB|nr:hypothetical protein [uncultured Prevotella sp.]
MEKMKFETKLKTLKTDNSPLVRAAFQGKDGNVYFGIILIDTGSFDCILNKSVMVYWMILPSGRVTAKISAQFKERTMSAMLLTSLSRWATIKSSATCFM